MGKTPKEPNKPTLVKGGRTKPKTKQVINSEQNRFDSQEEAEAAARADKPTTKAERTKAAMGDGLNKGDTKPTPGRPKDPLPQGRPPVVIRTWPECGGPLRNDCTTCENHKTCAKRYLTATKEKGLMALYDQLHKFVTEEYLLPLPGEYPVKVYLYLLTRTKQSVKTQKMKNVKYGHTPEMDQKTIMAAVHAKDRGTVTNAVKVLHGTGLIVPHPNKNYGKQKKDGTWEGGCAYELTVFTIFVANFITPPWEI